NRRKQKILFRCKRGEDSPLLGTVADTEVGNTMVRHAERLTTVYFDRAGSRTRQTQDGAQSGRAPGAVTTEKRDDFSGFYRKVDAMQNVRLTVPGVQVGNF